MVKEKAKAGEINSRPRMARGGPLPKCRGFPDGIPAGGRNAEAMDVKPVTIRARNRTEAIYKVTASTKLELNGVRTLDGPKPGMKKEAQVNRANKELINLELEDHNPAGSPVRDG